MLIVQVGTLPGAAAPQVIDDNPVKRYPSRIPIAWENVTDGCQFVDGVKPTWTLNQMQHVVDLAPGQNTDFLVAPHEMIRVAGTADQGVTAQDIEIWLSDGSGLMRKLNTASTSDGQSVVAAPDYPSWTVARIKRPVATAGRGFKIYTSQRQIQRGLDSYQCDLLRCGEAVEIREDSVKRPRSYFTAQPNRRIKLGARKGDSRVRFETRLDYNQDRTQHRSYWMKVYVNGTLQRILTFDTLPERYDRWFVNDAERLLGRKEFAWLDFQATDDVEIEFSHRCHLRTEALGLKLCQPRANWDLVEDLVSRNGALPDEHAANTTGIDSRFDPWLHHRSLLNHARDNNVRQGGLNAYMWIRAVATHRQHAPDYRDELTVPDLAAKIRGKYTHFRDLLPSSATSVKPRAVRFPIRTIRSPKRPHRQIILGSQHLEEAAGQLPATLMFPFSATGDGPGPLVYSVPENLGPSVLRVVIDKAVIDNETRFTIQYDQRPPIEFVASEETDIHTSLLKPGYQEAAMLALSKQHPNLDGSTLGGLLASSQRNAPTTIAATHELMIPAGVKRVTLREIAGDSTARLVGLQYLTSRYQKLSESEWLYLQHELRSGDPGRIELSRRLLQNQIQDLTGLFKSHLATFNASIRQQERLGRVVVSEAETLKMVDEAQRLSQKGNFTGLVELLSDLADASSGELKRTSLLARADALDRAGESFLTNRELRGLLAFGEDRQTQSDALNRLFEQAQQLPFAHLVMEQYRIFDMFNLRGTHQRSQQSKELAELLVENGRLRMAFFTHPPKVSEQPESFHLRSLFHIRWFSILENFAKHLSAERSSFWRGLKLIQSGDVESGLAFLHEAGPEAVAWIEHYHSGLAINDQLRSPDPQQRIDAISKWEQWQDTHPGPTVWQPVPDVVTDCRGAAHVYSSLRNLRSQFFIASNEQPATLEVFGPAKIRLEIRPVHPNSPESRFDEWYTVTTDQQQGLVAAIGNTPSQQLRVEGVERFVPGRLAITELRIPPGRHKIQLASRQHRFLFRVLQEQPEIRLPSLPVVSAATMANVITGDYGAMMVVEEQFEETDNDCVRVLDDQCHCRSQLLGKLADPHDCRSLEQAWRWLVRSNEVLAIANQSRFAINAQPLEQTEQDEHYVRAAKLAFELAGEFVDASHRLRVIAQLQQLSETDPTRDDLRAFLNYAKSGTIWQRFESFDSRAGVRSFDVEYWTPETPEARIRRSLAGLNRATWVVTGRKEASIEVDDTEPVHLRLKLRRPAVGYVPTTQSIAIVEVGNERQRIDVDDGPAKQIDFQLPAGLNRIRVAHETAWANHYLHVEAFEVAADGTEVPFGQQSDDQETRKRTWSVALPNEPLEFTVQGPGLYRVDRRVDGRSDFELHAIPESTKRTFTVYPDAGQSKAFVRVFELTVGNRPPNIYSPQQPVPHIPDQPHQGVVQAAWLEPIAELQSNVLDDFEDLALVPPDQISPVITEQDFQELGWQEIGTIATHFSYRQRRALDELASSGGDPGRFTESGITRYFHDRSSNTYRRNQLLVRRRESGGNTFGWNFRESRMVDPVEWEPEDPASGWGPIRTQWNAGVFAQDAGTPLIDGVSSIPWTAFGDATFSRQQRIDEYWTRRPQLQLFARYLSEEQNGFPSGDLDQDIFTRYKANHRYGARLSDQYVYQCCVDRRYWVRPRLVTNPDQLVPDNLGVHFGVDQLIGPLQLRLGYRFTTFFADNDRSTAAVQNLFDLDAMLETWHSRFWRSEARFSVRHDVNSGGTSFLFNLKSFLNQGRGYRDLPSQSTLFRSIREQRSLQHLMVQPNDAFVP